jgi:hypothetical protein
MLAKTIVISQVLLMETTVSHMHDLIAVFLPASRPPSLPSVNCP